MVTHRCVDTHNHSFTMTPASLIVKGMTHTMQALKFKFAIASQGHNHANGVSIVGSKLRVDLRLSI